MLILRMWCSILNCGPLTNMFYRMLAGYSVKLTAILILYAYMYLENKRRDRAALGAQESEEDGIENGMLDQTEIDNKAFRYVL